MMGLVEMMLEHAREDYPNEACGLVLTINGKATLHRCKNISERPTEQFMLCPFDYIHAGFLGKITAIYHSHPNQDAEASEWDKKACEASGLPWHIVAYPLGTHSMIWPVANGAPLIGRPFVHGVHDCYSLVQDYYRSKGILLDEFDRQDDWWEKGEDLYLANYESQGFQQVDELKEGDALLMRIRSKVPNHAAVYVGGGTILHHLYGRLSAREPYSGYYQNHTTHMLRHRSC